MSGRSRRGRLSRTLRVIRERWVSIVLVTLAFGVVAAAFDSQAKVSYTVFAQVEVRPLAAEAPFLGLSPVAPDVSRSAATDRVARLLFTRGVRLDALRRLGPSVPPSVLSRAGTSPFAQSQALVLVADEDARLAARVANALAYSAAAAIRREDRARLDRLIRSARREQRRLRGNPRRDLTVYFQRAELRRQATRLAIVRRLANTARVVRLAHAEKTPVFRPGERIPPALIVGLSLAIAAAFVLDAVASRPRDPQRLAAAGGLALVGEVPRPSRRGAGEQVAYGHLLAGLGSMAAGPAPEVVVLTGASQGADTLRVALGLAGAGSLAGVRTCVVECDLERAAAAERLGLDVGRGLGDRLAGRATDAEILRELPAPERGAEPVAIVLAGSAPAAPADALAGPRMHELVRELVARNGLVIVLAPPLLAGSGALALVAQADAVLVHAHAGSTTLEEMEAAGEALGRVAAAAAGLVMTGLSEGAAGAAPGLAARPAIREPV